MADAKLNRIGLLCMTTMAGGPSFGNFNLNQTTDQHEVIFQVPAGEGNISITRLGIRLGAITGTTPTYKISIQGVDASNGTPDGTIKGAGSPASKTFSPSSLAWGAGSWNWLTLDNAYSASPGEILALVVAYDSGTVDGSNFASFTNTLTNTPLGSLPYAIQNEAGTRTKQSTLPIFGWGSNSKAYGRPAESFANQTFNSGTTPDEYGFSFTLPAGWGDTFKIVGVELPYSFGGTGLTVLVSLYNGTTPLQTITVDSDIISSSSLTRMLEIMFDESSLSTLTFGSTYRLAFAPQNATNSTLWILQVDAAADWDAWPGGQDFALATRTNSGAWSADDATRRIIGSLILSDITEPSGGANVGIGNLSGGIVQ